MREGREDGEMFRGERMGRGVEGLFSLWWRGESGILELPGLPRNGGAELVPEVVSGRVKKRGGKIRCTAIEGAMPPPNQGSPKARGPAHPANLTRGTPCLSVSCNIDPVSVSMMISPFEVCHFFDKWRCISSSLSCHGPVEPELERVSAAEVIPVCGNINRVPRTPRTLIITVLSPYCLRSRVFRGP